MIAVAALVAAVAVPGAGHADSGSSASGTLVPAAQPVPRWAPSTVAAVRGPGLPGGTRASILACDTHAVGSFGYRDKTGTQRPGPNIQIQVRDQATGASVIGITNGAGAFDVCFTAAQFTRLYVTIKAQNSQWQVQNGTNVYNWSTPVRNNPVAGSTVTFGAMSPGSADDQRAAQAFDAADDAWLFTPHGTNCWDIKNVLCRPLVIDWSTTQAGHDGRSFYDANSNIVTLTNLAPTAPDVVTHEIGHAIMDVAYADRFPSNVGCPQEHHGNEVTTQTCAWIEGWADFYGLTAERTEIFTSDSGGTIDFESPFGVPVGDVVEINVGAALLDIADGDRNETWDQAAEGTSRIFQTLERHVDNTFPAFWSDRGADGFDVSDIALSALFQNQIDYDFHQPLRPDVVGEMPTPPNPSQRFTMTTTQNSWSAVAIRQRVANAGQDEDLGLYRDRAGQAFIQDSAQDSPAVEFIAVDSNAGKNPLTTYYPQVHHATGLRSSYEIVYSQSTGSLPAGTTTSFNFLDRQFLKVVELPGVAGQPISVTLTPGSGVLSADLYLVANLGSNKGFVSAASFSQFQVGHANGVPATMRMTPTVTANYAVVIVATNDFTGNFTLARS